MPRFETAKALYGEFDVDVDAALAALAEAAVSLHCWQGDDVLGFEGSESLSGGIAATGNHPGRARNADELFADIDRALSLIPGTHRLNIHAIYPAPASGGPAAVERDRLEPAHFARWVDFAKARRLGLDFNPTFFSHPRAAGNLTLSSPDAGVRKFWIDHGKACRRIAAHFGRELGSPALHNVWIPDGYKNIPADRLGPRARLKESLDALFGETLDPAHIRDAVESKVFGLGVEAYTVGSHEFYLNYAAGSGVLCLLDVGHFHPTETVSDKISALLLFSDLLALHVSRPVRWDSDHVVILDDELRAIGKELVRCDALDRVLIGLDFFDASINRVSAWVIGMRNMQKAILAALLLPNAALTKLQNEGRLGEVMAIEEEMKLYPVGDVWDHFCETHNAPQRAAWMDEIRKYEEETLGKRG